MKRMLTYLLAFAPFGLFAAETSEQAAPPQQLLSINEGTISTLEFAAILLVSAVAVYGLKKVLEKRQQLAEGTK